VGDDDQSIYGFRGAHVGNLAEFEKEYAKGQVIRLEQNYRSQGNILDAANALIANNAKRLGKNLWTSAGRAIPCACSRANRTPTRRASSPRKSAALRREGMRLVDIAVLYRSNAQSRVLEHALFGATIPYRVYGGLRFFERAEVKHALAYLRLVASPADDNSFLRSRQLPAARHRRALDGAAAGRSEAERGFAFRSTGFGQRAWPFKKLIRELQAETKDLPLPEMVEHVIQRSGLIEHYKKRARRRRPRREPGGAGQRGRRLHAGRPRNRRRRNRQPAGSPSSAMPRWKRANTRPARARTRCS
jgi:DNA helicase-2/ATP-dependent DNA helicase PcrA